MILLNKIYIDSGGLQKLFAEFKLNNEPMAKSWQGSTPVLIQYKNVSRYSQTLVIKSRSLKLYLSALGK